MRVSTTPNWYRKLTVLGVFDGIGRLGGELRLLGVRCSLIRPLASCSLVGIEKGAILALSSSVSSRMSARPFSQSAHRPTDFSASLRDSLLRIVNYKHDSLHSMEGSKLEKC